MRKKKVLILDSSFPINSRNIRLHEYLKNKHNAMVVTWNRFGNEEIKKHGYHIFNKKAKHGNRLLKAFYLPQYYRFIKEQVGRLRPDVIIASNWDMLILAALIKISYKFNLIYENRDMVCSRSMLLKSILTIIEKIGLNHANSMIMASRFFAVHYKGFKGDMLVIENKVSHDTRKYNRIESDKLRVSFIGSVRFYSILVNLIEAGRDIESMELHIYGDGPDKRRIKEYTDEHAIKNVTIHGGYEYSEIGKCYARTDVVWSVYPNTKSSGKKYVIPNKYYESLYFKVPGVFPANTGMGDLAACRNVGFVVDPYSIGDIRKLLMDILLNGDKLKEKVNNMQLINDDIIFENDVKKLEILLGG